MATIPNLFEHKPEHENRFGRGATYSSVFSCVSDFALLARIAIDMNNPDDAAYYAREGFKNAREIHWRKMNGL
jgi:hypothetical protein